MTKKTDAREWTKHRNRLLLHAGVSSGSALVAGGLTILSVYWSPLLMVGAGAAASFALMGLLEDSRNLKALLRPPKVRLQLDTLARLSAGIHY